MLVVNNDFSWTVQLQFASEFRMGDVFEAVLGTKPFDLPFTIPAGTSVDVSSNGHFCAESFNSQNGRS